MPWKCRSVAGNEQREPTVHVWIRLFLCVPAVHDRQLCGRLENSHDVAESGPDIARACDMRSAPNPWRVLFHMDYKIEQYASEDREHESASGCDTVVADVPQTVPHLSGDAATQQTVHGRLQSKHRRLEQNQLQHKIRP